MVERAVPAWTQGTRSAVIGAVAVAAATLAGGCSGTLDDVAPKRGPSYKSSRSTAPLEVPPDLLGSTLRDSLPISEGDATDSRYASRAGTQPASPVLPRADGARIERSGQDRWLVATAAPEALWPRLRDFWIDQGFTLTTENPEIGVMETDWAEKRTSLPGGALSGLTKQLSNLLYGVAFRDQYRTRIEPGTQAGTTEVYISHRGAEQMIVGDESQVAIREGLGERVWQIRPSDPGLEAEMLRRLMIFVGVDESRAATLAAESTPPEPRARIVRDADGATSLMLDEGFSPAWRRVGLALDRAAFTVEDRDRSRGVFFVRYAVEDAAEEGERKGFLSRLKFWGDDDGSNAEPVAYRIRLVEDGSDATRVEVLDGDGERESGPAANRILTVLHELLE